MTTSVLIRLAVPSPVAYVGRPAWCAADEAPAVGKLEWRPYAVEHAETLTRMRHSLGRLALQGGSPT